MIKLSVLWWIPEDGAWEHGWKHYEFVSDHAAYKFCRDNLTGIECAELGADAAVVVSDGRMVCAECGEFLLPTDVGIYPVCEGCDG